MPLSERFLEISSEVRNWDRWGPDDQLGTLNLITPEVVLAARDCIRHGRTIPLAVGLEHDGIQVGFVPGRDNGLCHVSYSGMVYNGYDASSITAVDGATRCGIEHLRSVCSRGVLLDVARARGVDMLECPYAITADDLDAAAEMGGVEVRAGDIVLVRTGRMSLYHSDGGMAYCLGPSQDGTNAGLSLSTVSWLHAHDVAAIANDTLAFEVYPSEADTLAVHMLHLVDMGLTQGQNWDLEALSEDCAADGVYEFFLSATPEPFVGGVGSPVAPVAIK